MNCSKDITIYILRYLKSWLLSVVVHCKNILDGIHFIAFTCIRNISFLGGGEQLTIHDFGAVIKKLCIKEQMKNISRKIFITSQAYNRFWKNDLFTKDISPICFFWCLQILLQVIVLLTVLLLFLKDRLIYIFLSNAIL